ncbi:MAG TPA: helical backbone metal receptor [Ignavibacteria bacterium]|nr:helical backbone metal receptor [Ignavibacteria bacterium]
MKNILIVILIILIQGCGGKKAPEGNIILKIKDDSGAEITFDKYPERIISLAPNITETIYALHAEGRLAGVTKYCNYPPEAQQKKIIGGMIDPDIEIITSLKPDLIIETTEGNSKASYQALVNAGFKVFMLNPQDINGITRMIKSIGEITNTMPRAIELSDSITNAKIIFENNLKNSKPAAVLVLLSINPLITCNSTTYINQVVELSGFENIYKNEPLPYPNISIEDVNLKNPGYIIITSDIADAGGNYLNFLKRNFSGTKAVLNGNIIVANADLLSRPGPRIIQAVNDLINKKKR